MSLKLSHPGLGIGPNAAELSDSLQHGFQHLLGHGPAYLIVQGLIILVCFRALSTENRRTQGIIAVGFLGGIIAWLFTRLFVI